MRKRFGRKIFLFIYALAHVSAGLLGNHTVGSWQSADFRTPSPFGEDGYSAEEDRMKLTVLSEFWTMSYSLTGIPIIPGGWILWSGFS